MLTGRRSSAHETLAEVTSTALERELSFADLPLAARPAIFRLLRRCLDRDPKRRMHDIGDGRIELEDALKAIGTPGTADRRPSIAVLPLSHEGSENEYFSDGLAEEILNALAQIPGLKVIARTSHSHLKVNRTMFDASRKFSTSIPCSKAAFAKPALGFE